MYTISQRSIHAQLNSGMGTNVGQRGLNGHRFPLKKISMGSDRIGTK